MTPTQPQPLRITFALGEPLVLTDPEPVSVPAQKPNADGSYSRVEYVASHARRATVEEVQRWRRGE